MILRIIAVVFGLLTLNLLTPRGSYRATRNIAFGPARKQRLDVFRARTPRPDAPLVVFVHGGGWRNGHRKAHRFVAETFTSAGYDVVLTDYRLYPEVKFPGFVDDTAAAVRWVHDHLRDASGEPRRLVLAGTSAGAHIAALLHLDRRHLAAAGVPDGAVVGLAGLCGPYDFLPLRDPLYIPIFPRETDHDSQPINFARADAPPTLLIAGTGDTTVDPGNTRRLAQRLRDAGAPVTEKIYPGVTHLGTVAALARILPGRKPPIRQDVLDFLATL